jgi:hypothetical protein
MDLPSLTVVSDLITKKKKKNVLACISSAFSALVRTLIVLEVTSGKHEELHSTVELLLLSNSWKDGIVKSEVLLP